VLQRQFQQVVDASNANANTGTGTVGGDGNSSGRHMNKLEEKNVLGTFPKLEGKSESGEKAPAAAGLADRGGVPPQPQP
jgi:hypothetical protein